MKVTNIYKEELKEMVNKAKTLEEKVETLGKWYEEHYYSPVKDIVVLSVIEDLDLPIIFTKKAISTHLATWHGWRRSFYPEGKQYCVRSHSGYVKAFVIPNERIQ